MHTVPRLLSADGVPQPTIAQVTAIGMIFIMNADGTNQRVLTRSKWEDSMPAIVP